MTTRFSNLPPKLIAVTVLFFLVGIYGIYQESTNLMGGHVIIPFNMLGLFVGYGILRLNRGWRMFGLILLWIDALAYLYLLVWVIMQGATGKLHAASPTWIVENLATISVLLVINFWMLHVLSLDKVRALFGLKEKNAS